MSTKIFINFDIEYNSTGVTNTTFVINFNWITSTGIFAGGNDKSITIPNNITVSNLNNAVIAAVTSAINASGKYTVHSGDQLILMNGFNAVVTH